MPKLGTDKEGKSFLDRFQSYRPKEETGQDKFYGELAKRMVRFWNFGYGSTCS